ncbi:MAG: glyoxalase/bleomycin resistance/dioxygenase family protein [Sulfuriferula multivorans]|uniref:Glyoxalase/bleomycin resistance/dioxygenase family protein n=1 Tax=Sulfuriferula multivorans TaxID=1559896 RepID=A0A7C9P6Y7_9PROT|nr:glyoxalase/bleomycin resistance/dioxygenase family protein [Sulfuriferula multivorans]
MKRLHVHVAVDDLAASIRFYSAMFASVPTVAKDDYAKWMLDDPRVNFAISARGAKPGLNHLGVQVESADELAEMSERLQKLDAEVVEEMGTACCYAKSDKYWATDPQGIAWETYHTLDSIPVFGHADASGAASGCCVPEPGVAKISGCIPLKAKPASGGCC